jgi:hypothetical protein
MRLLRDERQGGNKSKDDHQVVVTTNDQKSQSEKLPTDLAEKIRSAFNGRGPHQSIGLSIRAVILDWVSPNPADLSGRDIYQFVISIAMKNVPAATLTPNQLDQYHRPAALAEATYNGRIRRKGS